MEQFLTWLEQVAGIGPDPQRRILTSLLVILALLILHRLTLRSLVHRIRDLRTRYQWYKAAGYIYFLIGVLIVGRIWFEGMQAVATFLGLLSAGLAIALKDPITNLFAWAFILIRRPFEVGDRIQIGDISGDVIDLRIFQFTLMEIGNWVAADQSTGRILHVPNGMVFVTPLANYTKGSDYIWNEIPVLVTFESDWEKAKQLLSEIAEQAMAYHLKDIEQSFKDAARRFLLKYGKLTPIVYTSVLDSGVLLTIRYLCKPHERRGTSQEIWEQILRSFAQHQDIEFAYPTIRYYNASVEG